LRYNYVLISSDILVGGKDERRIKDIQSVM